MALVAPAEFDSWAKKSLAADVQAELVLCVAYAQSWIADQAGLRSLEKETTAQVSYFDGGRDTWGSELWVPMCCRPMWHTGSDLAVITENGAALTAVIGYSTTANVCIQGVNTFSRVRLSKIGGWYWGYVGANNVSVTSKCGFDGSSTATTNALPPDAKRLVMEVAWLMFNSAGRIGINNTAKAGSSADIINDLSPMGQSTLDWLRGV